ncbi:MAG: hypothetical protein ABWY05_06425 [Noviherbaspirillum sp.]
MLTPFIVIAKATTAGNAAPFVHDKPESRFRGCGASRGTRRFHDASTLVRCVPRIGFMAFLPEQAVFLSWTKRGCMANIDKHQYIVNELSRTK